MDTQSIIDLIGKLKRRVGVFEAYRDEMIELKSRHGVIDAECDMREFEAQIAILEQLLKGAE